MDERDRVLDPRGAAVRSDSSISVMKKYDA